MIDESTDSSNTKQPIYWWHVSESGESCTTYLRIVDLVDDTAEHIEEAIRAYLAEKEFALSKLMGFGSDGTALMCVFLNVYTSMFGMYNNVWIIIKINAKLYPAHTLGNFTHSQS